MLASAQERLRRAGYRVTKQRLAVYDYLLSVKSHPTAQDVYQAMQRRIPRVSLATAYQALDSLVDVGLVRRIHRGQLAARYDASSESHAHFRCLVCDEIRDVPLGSAAPTTDVVADCDIVGINFELFGYCGKCRRWKLGLPPSHTAGKTA